MKKLILFSALFLLMASFAMAQDKIYLKNKTVIECTINEIGTYEVKYFPFGEEEGPIYTIEVDRIEKVVLESGKEILFTDKMKDASVYEEQRKNALKFALFSPLSDRLSFIYERSLKPGRSVEAELGFIGVGPDIQERDPLGLHMKFGMKFFRSPDFYLQGMKYAHVLNGMYIRPDIVFSIYEHTPNYDNIFGGLVTERETVVAGAIILNLGRQWVFDDIAVLDIFVGVGYGFDNSTSEFTSNYGFVVGNGSFPIAFNSGLRVGILLD